MRNPQGNMELVTSVFLRLALNLARARQTRTWSSGIAVLFLVCLLLPRVANASPIVHPGDTLSLNVLNYSPLAQDPESPLHGFDTGSLLVAADGSISIPVAGTFRVAGRTTTQIASLVETKLARYVRQPAVSVRLLQQSQLVFLTGSTVGTLPFLPGETISTALGQLREQIQKDLTPVLSSVDKNGGTLGRSPIDLRKISLARDDHVVGIVNGEALLRSGEPGVALEPGDTLLFASKPIQVDVRGQVQAPGPVYLYSEDSLEQALLAAGGQLASASTADASLIRNGVEMPLPLGGVAIRQAPANGDIIDVHAAPHVTVIGQVESPGEQTLKNGSTLLVALYAAGGPTRWGNVRYIEVIHNGQQTPYDLRNLQHGDLSVNVPLSDGDVVYVPEGHKIDGRLFFQSILSTFNAATGVYDIERL